MFMSNVMLPVFAVFVIAYGAIAIVFDRRRARLAREREAAQDAKYARREAEREAKRGAHRLERDAQRAPLPAIGAPGQPYAPTPQDTAWLNTWLTDESFNN